MEFGTESKMEVQKQASPIVFGIILATVITNVVATTNAIVTISVIATINAVATTNALGMVKMDHLVHVQGLSVIKESTN